MMDFSLKKSMKEEMYFSNALTVRSSQQQHNNTTATTTSDVQMIMIAMNSHHHSILCCVRGVNTIAEERKDLPPLFILVPRDYPASGPTCHLSSE
jgi:hypothetical protein